MVTGTNIHYDHGIGNCTEEEKNTSNKIKQKSH